MEAGQDYVNMLCTNDIIMFNAENPRNNVAMPAHALGKHY